MKVTMKQIAEKAGVSINTVSLALRDMPNINIETRARICAIAAELGYYSQKKQRRTADALYLISTGTHLQDPYFYGAFQQQILAEALKNGYSMVVYDNEHWGSDAAAMSRQLRSSNVGGVLLLGDMDERYAAQIIESGLPTVAVSARFYGLRLCTFTEDNSEAAYLAVRHFVERGCRRIGFIGDPRHSTAFNERYWGFRTALSQFCMPFDATVNLLTLHEDLPNVPEAFEAALRELDHLPDAFYCANDYLGLGASKALHAMGLSIPDDISLIGTDNSPMGKLAIPSLTSIDVHCGLQVELAVRKLISFVRGAPYEPLRFVIPVTLSQGDSVRSAGPDENGD